MRWTIETASLEFAEPKSVIQRALSRSGFRRGKTGWTTSQIEKALTRLRKGSPEKVRLEKARAEKLEMDLAERRAQLIPAGEVSTQIAAIRAALGRVIERSKLDPLEKANLDGDLLRLQTVSTSPNPRKAKRKRKAI